ncbi:sigma-70 family RNA polymerase sigma factor [Planctomycetota bacterium]|nr:sigma-70 family RNA polymerase sigma factor [Planctomycetota bacterium]
MSRSHDQTSGTDSRSIGEFTEKIKPLLPCLLRVATYLTGNHAKAEDLVQETALKAQIYFTKYAQDTNFRAWIFTILKNTHVDLFRRERKHSKNISLYDRYEFELHATPKSEAFFMQDGSPELILNRFEDQMIIDALKQLPENIRLTLLLVDVEQINHTDTANLLDVPVGTIKSRAHRGRSMLRKALYQYAQARNINMSDAVSITQNQEVAS